MLVASSLRHFTAIAVDVAVETPSPPEASDCRADAFMVAEPRFVLLLRALALAFVADAFNVWRHYGSTCEQP